MSGLTFAVVVPTIGRASLADLLTSIARAEGPLPQQLIVVRDRGGPGDLLAPPARLRDVLTVVPGAGEGPAAARNRGWRATTSGIAGDIAWIVFLDDDVVVGERWLAELVDDLEAQPDEVGGVQGRLGVPLPRHRRPTDWERNTAGLQSSAWITADMAYRRQVLAAAGGFDERFPRAFREDADLALRVRARGYRLVRGARRSFHPVRPAGRWVSVRMQAGNADDVLMRRLHGRRWRALAEAPRGRRPAHLAVTAAAAAAVLAGVTGRHRLATLGLLGWLGGTARFAWSRISPGPRTADEVARMVATSAAIPPAAAAHWLRGRWRHRHAGPWPVEGGVPRAVLFDRDGTLIYDVSYNGDPAKVRPVDGAVEVIRDLRSRGLPVGVITNQSGIGRGRLTQDEVNRVNARVEQIFGRFDVWAVCPHVDADGCGCRKPAPGLILDAAARLGIPPADIVVIGDIGADVEAARAAGARAVLVPTETTRAGEVRSAPLVAPSLATAVRLTVGKAR